jgi:hypothetical protein
MSLSALQHLMVLGSSQPVFKLSCIQPSDPVHWKGCETNDALAGNLIVAASLGKIHQVSSLRSRKAGIKVKNLA